jgi:hypothetical protein
MCELRWWLAGFLIYVAVGVAFLVKTFEEVGGGVDNGLLLLADIAVWLFIVFTSPVLSFHEPRLAVVVGSYFVVAYGLLVFFWVRSRQKK